jgi:hypothetical protein
LAVGVDYWVFEDALRPEFRCEALLFDGRVNFGERNSFTEVSRQFFSGSVLCDNFAGAPREMAQEMEPHKFSAELAGMRDVVLMNPRSRRADETVGGNDSRIKCVFLVICEEAMMTAIAGSKGLDLAVMLIESLGI